MTQNPVDGTVLRQCLEECHVALERRREDRADGVDFIEDRLEEMGIFQVLTSHQNQLVDGFRSQGGGDSANVPDYFTDGRAIIHEIIGLSGQFECWQELGKGFCTVLGDQ